MVTAAWVPQAAAPAGPHLAAAAAAEAEEQLDLVEHLSPAKATVLNMAVKAKTITSVNVIFFIVLILSRTPQFPLNSEIRNGPQALIDYYAGGGRLTPTFPV